MIEGIHDTGNLEMTCRKHEAGEDHTHTSSTILKRFVTNQHNRVICWILGAQ